MNSNEKLPPNALIEAVSSAQTEPLNEKSMRKLCASPLSRNKLIDVLAQLKTRWQSRVLQLVRTYEGWRFQVAQTAFEWLGSLQEQHVPRYSRAMMETLAVIAYQQPVTRDDIEGIHGVAVSQDVIQTLRDRGWIEAIGYRGLVGWPALWATTATFLSNLRLDSLEGLPSLTELGELVLPDLVETPSTDTDKEENDMLRSSENGELLLD